MQTKDDIFPILVKRLTESAMNFVKGQNLLFEAANKLHKFLATDEEIQSLSQVTKDDLGKFILELSGAWVEQMKFADQLNDLIIDMTAARDKFSDEGLMVITTDKNQIEGEQIIAIDRNFAPKPMIVEQYTNQMAPPQLTAEELVEQAINVSQVEDQWECENDKQDTWDSQAGEGSLRISSDKNSQ